MIRITNLHHRILALSDLSLKEGVTTVLGPNGSGKTTLLSICAGLIIPDMGSVRIDGMLPRETEVGWVSEFPDRNILFERVFDEIAAPLRFRRRPMDEINLRTAIIAERLQITPLLSRTTRSLSGGEKVLVALACAIVTDPLLLVIDEADSHLDRETARQVQEAIRSDPPKYLLQSSQYREIVKATDQVIELSHGTVKRI
ncbi:MAG: ATP-binding cassette domain-containing protein [Methanocalculus sp.]|uniref:ATP-binding cassette domain-containing protein n=1 Tax=Methanocalculus sp. TaxID=2004547 RepID=UPI002719DFCB|nr:ATP-binding cassette domain-containing protein [Methanocalculus sp.]MDO9540636.1 ATP-binding cassette domain-containing protein [Methanocalculus sp.]